MEEKVTHNNVDIAKVDPAYHLCPPTEVEVDIGNCKSVTIIGGLRFSKLERRNNTHSLHIVDKLPWKKINSEEVYESVKQGLDLEFKMTSVSSPGFTLIWM